MREARRAGIVTLLLLLAGGPLMLVLPAEVAAVRVGGVGLLWWYSLLVAPAIAFVVSLPAMLPTSRSALTWVGPACFAWIVVQVGVGAPAAPLLVLAAVVAWLLAPLLLARDLAPGPVAAPLALVGLTLLLAADLTILAELAEILGSARASSLVVGAATAWLLAFSPTAPRWRLLASTVAALALVPALVAIAAGGGGLPWQAWERQASRAVLGFAPSSHWVTEGGAPPTTLTLTFSEAHRLTALNAGRYRVTEREGDRPIEREVHLAPGDTLTLRAGDELTLTPQTRVRFEAGKQVPGAATSGMQWADPPERLSPTTLAVVLGMTVTLVGGAVGLTLKRVPRAARLGGLLPALGLPVLMLVSAAWWGVYAALDGPRLLLETDRLAMLRVPPAWLDARWAARLPLVLLAGAAALFVATALALYARTVALMGRAGAGRRPLAVWSALVGAAAVVGVLDLDPWRMLGLGFGLLATVLGAPALTHAGPTARTAGALVGGLTFVAVALLAPRMGSWMAVLGTYPALIAAPLAWSVTRLGQGAARVRRPAPPAGDVVAAGRLALRQ